MSTVRVLEMQLSEPGASERSSTSTFFDGTDPPDVTMTRYVHRFVHYHDFFEWPVLTIALIYMRRIQQSRPEHRLNMYNVHRMLCAAFVLAYKFAIDEVHTNAAMGKLGGIGKVDEMNRIEMYALDSIDWKTHVTAEEFWQAAVEFDQADAPATERIADLDAGTIESVFHEDVAQNVYDEDFLVRVFEME